MIAKKDNKAYNVGSIIFVCGRGYYEHTAITMFCICGGET